MTSHKRISTVLTFAALAAGMAILMGKPMETMEPILDAAPAASPASTVLQTSAFLLLAPPLPLTSNTIELKVVPSEQQSALIQNINLDATTQWAIYDVCDRDNQLFCTVMAIAWKESLYQTDIIGDGGDSIGMMQINTRWNTDRMERLGVTDLTDPVQSAMVAVDLLRELAETFDSGISDTTTLMAYNMGPTGAKRAMDAGTYETTYTQEVIAMLQTYLQEMEGSHD